MSVDEEETQRRVFVQVCSNVRQSRAILKTTNRYTGSQTLKDLLWAVDSGLARIEDAIKNT